MVNGNLPDGWEHKTLRSITKVIYRYPTFFGMEHLQNGVPVIRGEHINADGTISHDWADYWYVSHEISKYFPRTKVDLQDLIMSVRGSVGKLGIIDESLQGAQVSPNCIRISLNKDICSPKFLLYFLKSTFAQSLIQDNVNSTTIQTIKASSLSETPIPVPPLPEQERIVAKIEELFTQLDAGTAALKRVRAGLKRYKASVLKAAVDGRLFESRGIVNSDELPDGWRWVKLSEITSQVKDVDHKMPKPADSDIPYISTKDFTGDEDIDFENAKHVSEEDYVALTRKIKPGVGDILLSRYGTIGEIRKVKTDRRFQASYSIAIIKPITDLVFPDFLIVVLRSEVGQEQMRKNIRASSQPDLGLEYIRKFDIPLPPLEEQRRIVAEVEQVLSVASQVESVLTASVTRAARLRQAVLKAAFEGKLLL